MRLLLFISIFFSCGLIAQQAFVYPKANASNQADTIWGRVVKDPYRWMEKIDSPEIMEWLNEENKLAQDYNKKLVGSLKENIEQYSYVDFKRFTKQGKYYFSKTIEGERQTAKLFYQQYTYTEPMELFDPNKLERNASTHIDGFLLSPDEKTLALTLSKNGSDWQTIRFFDMEQHKLLDDTLNFVRQLNKDNKVNWFKDGIYYVRYDLKNVKESFKKTVKGQTLYYHKLGTRQSEDILIHKPSNKSTPFVYDVTPEGKYLILFKDTVIEGTPLYYVMYSELKNGPLPNFKVFISLIPTKGKLIDINVLGEMNGKLLVQSNFNAPTGAIFKYDLSGRNKKQVVVPAYNNTQLEFAKIVGNKILTLYSNDTASFAYLHDSTGKAIHGLRVPVGNRFDLNHFSYSNSDNTLLLSYYSFFSPPIMFEYNINTLKSEPLGKTIVYKIPEGIITRKVYYYSKDSTRVPMFITYKEKTKLNGNNALLLYGYGGFGISMEPFYDPANVIFIENGGILATPCIRGGGEYPDWHEQGRRLNKQNSFDDFIAAAEYLIANKYTNPEKIAAMGGSNGGLLVGAVMLQRPDLFKVVVSQAGLFDMLRFHLYDLNYLNKGEYGNVKDTADFKNLYSYSPAHNVKEGVNYPATLLVASDNDNRVNPFHSFKFIASLQAKGGNKQPYILYYEKGGGHSGGVTFEKHVETKAFIYAFIFKQLGMKAKGW